jgi:hypothetical protein
MAKPTFASRRTAFAVTVQISPPNTCVAKIQCHPKSVKPVNRLDDMKMCRANAHDLDIAAGKTRQPF